MNIEGCKNTPGAGALMRAHHGAGRSPFHRSRLHSTKTTGREGNNGGGYAKSGYHLHIYTQFALPGALH